MNAYLSFLFNNLLMFKLTLSNKILLHPSTVKCSNVLDIEVGMIYNCSKLCLLRLEAEKFVLCATYGWSTYEGICIWKFWRKSTKFIVWIIYNIVELKGNVENQIQLCSIGEHMCCVHPCASNFTVNYC